MQDVIFYVAKRCKVWKVGENCFTVKEERAASFTEGIKLGGSSVRRVVLLLFPLLIFMVIYLKFYRPPCTVQLLNEAK